jgi:hypothetical protein
MRSLPSGSGEGHDSAISRGFCWRMFVVSAFEHALMLALRTSQLITTAKVGCALGEIAKQRYELLAVRTKGADIPHSNSEGYGKHWGHLSIGRGPNG